MRISEAILTFLKESHVEYIFGIPAGTVSPLYDSLNDVNIKLIVGKNEGGCSFMAARYASVSGKLGVCMGAGGVGVNNMLNGIADAMRSKTPLLVITGYVHRWQIGKGAIQELNTEDILKPITKYSKTVMDEKEVLKELKYAMELAQTHPMGPVHLSIPIDIQLSPCVEEMPLPVIKESKATLVDNVLSDNVLTDNKELLDKAVELLKEAKQGLILVGKGARGYSTMVMELSKHLNFKVITTPEAKGLVPSDFPLNLGNYGFASTDAAVAYVTDKNTDTLLVLGSSLGENSTSNFSTSLFDGKKTIHIDIDKKELGKVFETDVCICGDICEVISYFMKKVEKAEKIDLVKSEINKPVATTNTGLSLREFMEQLPSYMPNDTFYVSDMGEFMNFIYKYLQIPTGGDFEVNLNYAAMGSGIGGVVGVQAAYPNRTVAVFAGDGSFFMNGNEILTAKEYNLPIIYFIINNAMLGFVEHGHQFLFNRVVHGFKQERINIADVAKACGIKAMQIANINEMEEIPEFIKNSDGPIVIELITDGSEIAPNGDRLKSLQKK